MERRFVTAVYRLLPESLVEVKQFGLDFIEVEVYDTLLNADRLKIPNFRLVLVMVIIIIADNEAYG